MTLLIPVTGKLRGWLNKIAAWLCISLSMSSAIWLTNVYGNSALNVFLSIIIIMAWIFAVYPFNNILSKFLYSIFSCPTDNGHEINVEEKQ